MCNFYVGQKVVCVDASTASTEITLQGLTQDIVYTIRWVGLSGRAQAAMYGNGERPIGVRLNEIRRAVWSDGEESCYAATRFRPLVETDISIFTAMLSPTPAKRESEDA